MTCDGIPELAELVLDNRVSPEERSAFDLHISTCDACAKTFDENKRFRAMLDSGLKKIARTDPDLVDDGRRALLNKVAPKPRRIGFLSLMTAAACIAIVSAIVFVALNSGEDKTLQELAAIERKQNEEIARLKGEVDSLYSEISKKHDSIDDESARQLIAVILPLASNGSEGVTCDDVPQAVRMLESKDVISRAAAFKFLKRRKPSELAAALEQARDKMAREQIQALMEIAKGAAPKLSVRSKTVVSIQNSTSSNGKKSGFEFKQFSDGSVYLKVIEDSGEKEIIAADIFSLVKDNFDVCRRLQITGENGILRVGMPIKSADSYEGRLVEVIKSGEVNWDGVHACVSDAFKNLISSKVPSEEEFRSRIEKIEARIKEIQNSAEKNPVIKPRARGQRYQEISGKIDANNDIINHLNSFLRRLRTVDAYAQEF